MLHFAINFILLSLIIPTELSQYGWYSGHGWDSRYNSLGNPCAWKSCWHWPQALLLRELLAGTQALLQRDQRRPPAARHQEKEDGDHPQTQAPALVCQQVLSGAPGGRLGGRPQDRALQGMHVQYTSVQDFIRGGASGGGGGGGAGEVVYTSNVLSSQHFSGSWIPVASVCCPKSLQPRTSEPLYPVNFPGGLHAS